jgi:Flp pilus assembly protein TadG
VEFTLIAPVLLSLFIFSVDIGSAILVYTQMAAAAREAARQAVLENTKETNNTPSCYTATPRACQSLGVIPQIRGVTSIIPWGVNITYNEAGAWNTGPTYLGSYTPNADANKPGTIQLKPDAANSTIFVFVYQTGPDFNPRWASTGAGSQNARTGGHQMVVVDLKMRWLPVTMEALGIRAPIVLDAQTVERMEW